MYLLLKDQDKISKACPTLIGKVGGIGFDDAFKKVKKILNGQREQRGHEL